MKRCPRCGQTYTDPDINFCLNDGELLSRQTDTSNQTISSGPSYGQVDDSPPTMVLEQARVTNPIGWSAPAQPPAQWRPAANQLLYPNVTASPAQTLGILSLCFGLA